MDTLHVACVQMQTSNHLARNLSVLSDRISQAHALGCTLLVLPENFSWMGAKDERMSHDSTSLIEYFLKQSAQQYKMWIVAGSILWQEQEGQLPFNRCWVFNPEGERCQYYDKIHLFEACLQDEQWREADEVQAGKVPRIVPLDAVWKMGLSICYDVRFSRLYRFYAAQSCNIMTVPAAFAVETGRAHWEVLLRARAIECQTYVLAAAQWGTHADGRKTYGHSMIVDPWGTVLDVLPEGEGLVHAELSLSVLEQARARLPSVQTYHQV